MVIVNLIQDLKLKLKTHFFFFFFCAVIGISIVHNKLSMLEAYNIARKYNAICISESYLDSTLPLDSLSLNGYNLTHADHPDNVKERRCLYVLQGKSIPYDYQHSLLRSLFIM